MKDNKESNIENQVKDLMHVLSVIKTKADNVKKGYMDVQQLQCCGDIADAALAKWS